MTKRLIGIDLDRKSLRLAVLSREHGIISVVSVTERNHEEAAEPVVLLQELLDGELHLGDRLAACLPSGSAFVRRLTFPFNDRKKISAALPFELATQLPVALEGYQVAMQPPVRTPDGGATTVVAAVKTAQLAESLKPFDEQGLPLHVLDLAPHAYVAGLKNFLADGLLVCAMTQETSVALVRAGEIVEYRQLPLGPETQAGERARAIHREATALERMPTSGGGSALQLMGPLATRELAAELGLLRQQVELLSIDIGGQIIEAPFLPAVALALRAADSGRGPVFNLRQGAFALKGEWAGLRKALVMAACLAGLTLVTVAASMGLNYYDKQRQVDTLEQQLVTLYKESFPQATTVVDVPLQLKSAIRQLQEDVGIADLNGTSSLHLLQTLSALPEALDVDIDELIMERDEVRISGRTSSFDAVNRMAETFRQSSFFEKVEVAESKMDLAGQQVGYRMRMTLNGKGTS